MPVNMEQTNCQFEFQVIGKFEIAAGVHSLHHMNTPLTHDIIEDERGLYSLHTYTAACSSDVLGPAANHPLWLPNSLVPVGNVLFLYISKSLISGLVSNS